MRYFSMFSGIGGFELGILRSYRKKNRRCETNKKTNDEKRQGLESSEGEKDCSEDGWNGKQYYGNAVSRATCVGYSEIDKYAIQVYKRHFPNHKGYGDATKINATKLPDFDLLVGGFPCQAFSIAGKRQGFDDTRGTMFFEIARIVREKQPRLLLLENVKGLLSHDKGKTFAVIITTLDELGYDAEWQVLNSKDFGVPQNRERVFIIGHLRGTGGGEIFPFGGADQEDTRVIGEDVAYTIDANYHKGTNTLEKSRRSVVQLNQPKHSNDRIYGTEGVNPTINTAQDGRRQPFIPDDSKIRRLTPTECERLQGFPDGWTEDLSDTQRYKCLGNAVTVNVIEAIMDKVMAQAEVVE